MGYYIITYTTKEGTRKVTSKVYSSKERVKDVAKELQRISDWKNIRIKRVG